ncbi:polysaccharide deacetylase family protein [Pseudorhodobacter sp.]|uniref:polysaccharide deacetylase family protein n=1 Tax=Pseudorhodobacter sp. TaxID=1934400 RepID=UPI002648EF1E|nr:polysaccharide deacetylase family protein [Pseudorhodobacter sp.]MDN5786470.1 polysaccharide deacetylase family protein [Pseudorhodobacter sp.]
MRRLVKAIDLGLAHIMRPAQSGVAILGFHGLMPDDGADGDGTVDPYQPFTCCDLDRLITSARAAGLRFICGRDLDRLATGGRADSGTAIWLTFDDGYANNLGALPILRKHSVPATFFITSGAVASGDAFWWDVLYREGRRRNQSIQALAARREALKACPPAAIRATLIADFGETAFRPCGDLDRPMTAPELSAFARDPLVEIGNHTQNHAILSILPEADQRREIAGSQDFLARVTGNAPQVIAYPNGGATPATLRIAGESGLMTGVTCLPHRNALPPHQSSGEQMALGRFMGLRHDAMERETRLAFATPALAQYNAVRSRRPLLDPDMPHD